MDEVTRNAKLKVRLNNQMYPKILETYDAIDFIPLIHHYENTPIQIYWKFYHLKMKIFR